MDNLQLAALLGLQSAMRLTPNRYRAIFEYFGGDWVAAEKATSAQIIECGLDKRGLQQLQKRNAGDGEKALELLKKCGANVVTYTEELYPKALKNIDAAPMVLYVRGSFKASDDVAVAVVGSRKISAYGKRCIEHFVPPMVKAGATIVSGLAMGADTVAHNVALKEKGRTIGVLGCGIDRIYPASSRQVAEQILDGNGAIISEYLPGTSPRPEYFPERNRIVSGLSQGVFVACAQERSGSLITGRLGVEQGKEVFAVPGSIFDPSVAGTNQLISKGMAHPALSPTQVLEILGLDIQKKKATSITNLSDTEQQILLGFENEHQKHINELIQSIDMPAHVVSAHINILVLKGALRHMGDQVYSRN